MNIKKVIVLLMIAILASSAMVSCDNHPSGTVATPTDTASTAGATASPSEIAPSSEPSALTTDSTTPAIGLPTIVETETAAPSTSVIPTSSPTPTTTLEPPLVLTNTSGTFGSDTGTYLNLACAWSVEKIEDTKNYLFEMNINIMSYSLYVTARNNGLIKVGSVEKTFYTPDISIDPEAGYQATYCTTFTSVLTEEDIRAGLIAYVSWSFHGTYSGVQIDVIEATENIIFC